MSARGVQLALRFPLSSRTRFDSFVTGANAELVGHLRHLGDAAGFAGCLLYGPAGVGRTHLLQAACHQRGDIAGTAIYLPLADPVVTAGSLNGLERLPLVALDDIEGWLGRADTEQALLALYQGLQAGGGKLLVSAAAPATRLEFHFADLASRLRALPTYRVQPLADADKARVLGRLATERGLDLAPAVLEFWLARSPRDLASLVGQLERLDEAAMAAKRRVTVPLLKEVLGL